jgi:hypothetical protein
MEGVTFKTGTENIFLPFVDGDVEATSVTLRWIPGRIVTAIQLEPGGIVHTVTPTRLRRALPPRRLASETNYTVTLKNGSKTRGVLTFMTLVDMVTPSV